MLLQRFYCFLSSLSLRRRRAANWSGVGYVARASAVSGRHAALTASTRGRASLLKPPSPSPQKNGIGISHCRLSSSSSSSSAEWCTYRAVCRATVTCRRRSLEATWWSRASKKRFVRSLFRWNGTIRSFWLTRRISCSETRVCAIPNGQKHHLSVVSHARKNTDRYKCVCVTV